MTITPISNESMPSVIENFATSLPTNVPIIDVKFCKVYCSLSYMSAPWGVGLPKLENSVMFHLVLKGNTLVRLGEEDLLLNTGDFLFLPHGQGHQVINSNKSIVQNLFDLKIEKVSDTFETLTINGEGDETIIFCGTVFYNEGTTAKIVDSMPSYLKLAAANGLAYSTARNLVSTISDELSIVKSEDFTNKINDILIVKLVEALVIHLIGCWTQVKSESQINWLKGLMDERLGNTLTFIHQNPNHELNVDLLACKAGMSRTLFISYFKQVLGVPPKKYIVDWKLSLSKDLLVHTDNNILNIALDLGYQSESTFGRAFKLKFGATPSKFRLDNR